MSAETAWHGRTNGPHTLMDTGNWKMYDFVIVYTSIWNHPFKGSSYYFKNSILKINKKDLFIYPVSWISGVLLMSSST